jgi:hypothetical protein
MAKKFVPNIGWPVTIGITAGTLIALPTVLKIHPPTLVANMAINGVIIALAWGIQWGVEGKLDGKLRGALGWALRLPAPRWPQFRRPAWWGRKAAIATRRSVLIDWPEPQVGVRAHTTAGGFHLGQWHEATNRGYTVMPTPLAASLDSMGLVAGFVYTYDGTTVERGADEPVPGGMVGRIADDRAQAIAEPVAAPPAEPRHRHSAFFALIDHTEARIHEANRARMVGERSKPPAQETQSQPAAIGDEAREAFFRMFEAVITAYQKGADGYAAAMAKAVSVAPQPAGMTLSEERVFAIARQPGMTIEKVRAAVESVEAVRDRTGATAWDEMKAKLADIQAQAEAQERDATMYGTRTAFDA